MKTILDYKLKKVGRPRISKGTLFLEGYGISIKINNKKLLIRNGKEQEITRLEIRNGSYNLPQESYFTGLTDRADFDRIIIQGSGYITFDAMQWLTEWGIRVIMIDKRGRLYGNFNQVLGNNEPLIRQKQYDCFRDSKKLEYLRKWVVSHKVTSQIMILRDIQSFRAIEYMEKQLLKLENSQSLNEISEIESVSAIQYYMALSKSFLQINPELNFKNRKNPMTDRNNDANDIVNSLLNYGFGIIQAEIGKQLNGIGLDCNVGFYHKNHGSHTPLIWDMMEHFRYLVDKSVLQIANI